MCFLAAQCNEKSEYKFEVVEEVLVCSYDFSYAVISLFVFNYDCSILHQKCICCFLKQLDTSHKELSG